MKSCFFIGHHMAPDSIIEKLDEAVERHITEYGVAEFIVGHYGDFDHMVRGALRRAKKRHSHIFLLLLLPYHPTEHPIEVPEGFSAYYPPGMEEIPQRFAIVRANRIVIGSVDYLICYDAGHVGSTRELVAYARRREKEGRLHIENLAE